MRKIISKTSRLHKKAVLYIKSVNCIRITVVLTIENEIKTYWFAISKKKQQKWYKDRLKENHKILDNLKLNGCAICGYDKCNEALEFHHVNPKNREFSLNADNMDKNTNMVKEINKCILLCANCHKEIHAKERSNK